MPLSRRRFLAALGVTGAAAALPGASAAAAAEALGLPRATRSWEQTSLVRVRADEAGVARLQDEFDLTEHGHGGWFDVVLHPGDRARLEAAGFEYETIVEDLIAADVRDRLGELEAARTAAPGQRVTYRFLEDYRADLEALATQRPDLVRFFTLPLRTSEGREVWGVEIGGNVASAATDGRPTSLICGLHHAREWPSAELTMMLAEDLVDEYAKGSAAIVDLLDNIRVLVVPVVNPDGFVRSRHAGAYDSIAPMPGAAALVSEFAYHRKNMRKNSATLVETGQGTDPNRNYAYGWGGTPGASATPSNQTYFGVGPSSEPEVENISWLVRSNQVLTLITNHTYSNLVLRPWGHVQRVSPDEAQLKELGDAMAAVNGYTSQRSIQLYATTGTTDDWSYGVTGGFGYTFEIGHRGIIGLGNTHPAEGAGFHPQYNLHVPSFYELNRGAFLLALQAARNEAYHCVLEGSAPEGTRISARKVATYDLGRSLDGSTRRSEELRSSIVVNGLGRYTWHVNPSPLPATLEAGGVPEAYTLTAERPDGTSVTRELVVRRGQRYTVDF